MLSNTRLYREAVNPELLLLLLPAATAAATTTTTAATATSTHATSTTSSAAATAAATATDTAPATAAAATGTGYRLSGQDLDWRFQILRKVWGRSSHNWQGLGFSVLSFLFGVWGVEFWVWCLSRASGAKGRLGAGAPKP